MFYGKIVAGALGLLLGGPIGLLVGLFIGHSFDKGLVKTLQVGSPENIERIKTSNPSPNTTVFEAVLNSNCPTGKIKTTVAIAEI